MITLIFIDHHHDNQYHFHHHYHDHDHRYHIFVGQIEMAIHPAIGVEHVFIAKIFSPVVVVDRLKIITIIISNMIIVIIISNMMVISISNMIVIIISNKIVIIISNMMVIININLRVEHVFFPFRLNFNSCNQSQSSQSLSFKQPMSSKHQCLLTVQINQLKISNNISHHST